MLLVLSNPYLRNDATLRMFLTQKGNAEFEQVRRRRGCVASIVDLTSLLSRSDVSCVVGCRQRRPQARASAPIPPPTWAKHDGAPAAMP
jgi:hypothetical protein